MLALTAQRLRKSFGPQVVREELEAALERLEQAPHTSVVYGHEGQPVWVRAPVVAGGFGAPSRPSCGPSGEAIYLLDDRGVLHGFAPPLDASSSFRTVGQVTCRLPDGTPWTGAGNMALDASETAWVTDTVGHLFRVSTADASCQATTSRRRRPQSLRPGV